MFSIGEVFSVLFSGAGAIVIGVLLERRINQRTASGVQLTEKTRIVTPAETKPKKNLENEFSRNSQTNLSETPQVISTMPQIRLSPLDKQSDCEFFRPELSTKTHEFYPHLKTLTPNSKQTSHLVSLLRDEFDLGKDVVSIAEFSDGSFSASNKKDDKFVFYDKNNNNVLISFHEPDNLKEITFKKNKKDFKFTKLNSDTKSSSRFPSFNNEAIGIDEKHRLFNLDINTPGIQNIPESYLPDNGDQLLFASKDEGIVLACRYDPSKWEEASIENNKDTLTLVLRKKK